MACKYRMKDAEGAWQTITSKPAMMAALADGRLDHLMPGGLMDGEQPSPAPAAKPSKPAPAPNTVFTEDAAAKARELLRRKLAQLNSGIDPEMLQAGITLAGYHIEKGARTFSAYAQAMIADLGDTVRPYLKSWYMGVKYDPRAAGFDGMDTAMTVEAASLDSITSNKQQEFRDGNDESGIPRVGENAGSGDQEQRGSAEPATARQNPADLGEVAAENDDAPAPSKNRRGSGRGAAGSNVERRRSVREGGDASDGRERDGGAGVADVGAGSGRGNYHVGDPEQLIGGTPKVRFKRNRAAIEAFQSITSEGREPTQEELDAMAGYIGWGSFGQELFQGTYERPAPKDGWAAESEWLREHLGKDGWESAQKSIINAHYTDPITVSTMWDMVRRLGFNGGRVLEPSMGVGNFFGLMPRDLMAKSRLAGIEMETTTGGMAQMLYPDANIQIKPYQDSRTADGFYDLVIGNWPFAKDGPADRRYMRLSPSLHDFFFLKALDQTRPGGLVVGITSAGTMDKKGTLTRAALAEKADLVAAFRLPSGAFEKYAGTSVVTDIIILKKRADPNTDLANSGWLRTSEVDTASGQKVTVNEYYAKNPQNILGTLNFGSGSTYGRPSMIVDRPADLEARMAKLAETLPEGIFSPHSAKAKTVQYVTNNTKDRQLSVVDQGGKLFQVQGEYLAPLEEIVSYKLKDAKRTAEREKQIRDLVGMRRLYGKLIDAERDGLEDAEAKRAALKAAYTAFVGENGLVADSDGLKILKRANDPFYPVLASLETPNGHPSAILSRPTVRARRRLEKPNVRDALVLARNESVDIDLNRVAELAGVSADQAAKELMGLGAIFRTPEGGYESADVYLSGNVRRKLREAEAAAQEGEDMARNIEALKSVLPKDIPYFNIEAKLGATWVRPEQYQNFIAHLLGMNAPEGIEVRWAVNRWKVKFIERGLNMKPEATTTWGHPGVKFDRLLTAAMGNVAVKVQYRDDDGNLQTDEKATAEANEKASKLREEFGTWLWSEPVRKIEMERTFNEVMNAIALPKFDGSFLTFEGMALQRGDSPFSMREHQVNAVWRGLANGRSLNAHEVGTGKTYTMGALAVESRRYGMAKKPIIFAHNANSASVAREIGEQYPGAKILYIDNLNPERIGVTLRQIANDEWDAIVVPHSLIDRFTLKRESLMEISREQIEALEQEAIEAAQEDGASLSIEDMDDEEKMKKVRSATAKQLVHARNAILKKIEEMALRSSKEDAISFEDMGIDMVIVDEAHEFKKPPLATRMRMKGLNTGTSNQSISLMFLTDYVKRLNAGRGVHLFTGTPITNTMTEIYNMMRYVMDDQMARDGIREWDAWFNTFADSTSDVELTAAGEYEPVTRLAAFVNVSELRRMIGQYMDIVFADDMPEFKPRSTAQGRTLGDKDLTEAERLGLLNGRTENPIGRPYKKVVADVAEMTPDQQNILARLQEYANRFKNASKKERREIMLAGRPESPVLVETGASNAGLDARLYDMNASDAPNNKVNRAVRRIMEHYNEHPQATQVVFVERGFSDASVSRKKDRETGQVIVTKKERFNLVADMVDKLVAQGVNRDEIAIVDGSTSKDKRKAIADAMNRAEVRVVIGNTKTLGVGVNMQTNLRAMHHLDAPWMPGDLEQRNGRGHRQGNKWNTVMEYRYLTERIDGRRWQVLAVKDRFIKAFLKAKDDVRVIEGDAVSMDEEGDIGSTLADAAGDPRLLTMNKLKADVLRLENKERMHAQGIADASEKIRQIKRDGENGERVLAGYRKDDAAFREAVKGSFVAQIDGKTYTDIEAANAALAKAAARKLTEAGRDTHELGTLWGFTISAYWPSRFSDVQYAISSETFDYAMGKGTIESARQTLYGIKGRGDRLESQISEAEASLPRMEEAVKAPFARAGDLEKKRKMLTDLEADIQRNPIPAPAWLRSGAPANTEVYVGGKPYVVEGHRWTAGGYFVTVSVKDDTRDVPYTEVTDENGLAIYEEKPFEAPTVAKSATEETSPRGAAPAFSRSAGAMPSTISVDGVERPTTNSKGQPIHPTEAGVRKFWRWFGSSRVVDDQGRPLVVYHGTRGDFSSFYVPNPEGKQRFYFAADPAVASEYSNDSTGRPGEGANMMPVYVALKKPAMVDGGGANFTGVDLSGVPDDLREVLPSAVVRRGYASLSSIASAAEAQGYDGVIVRNVRDGAGPYGEQNPSDVFIAFRPEQIKSATGNRGTFDGASANILRSASPAEQPASGITAESLPGIFAQRFPKLAGAVRAMLDRGALGQKGGLVVLDTNDETQIAREFADRTGRTFDETVQMFESGAGEINGFYDALSGTTFLVGPNLDGDTASAVMLHEMTHGQQRQSLDEKALAMINDRAKAPRALGQFLTRVAQRMEDVDESGNASEATAYIVEMAVQEGRQAGFSAADGPILAWIEKNIGKPVADLVREFVAMARAWALAHGVQLKRVAVDDLVAYAQAGVRKAAKGNVKVFLGKMPKSAAAGPEFSRSAAVRTYRQRATNLVNETFSAPGKLSWWHKTVGTMYDLAERSPYFKPVFQAAQSFVDDVSHYANDAAEMAPKLLPKLDAWRDIWKSPVKAEDNKAVAKPIFEGTLMWKRGDDGRPVRVTDDEADSAGIVWHDSELRSMFGLNDAQIGLYREFRAATNRSLDSMARADMLRYGGKDAKAIRDRVMDARDLTAATSILRQHFRDLAMADPNRAEKLTAAIQGIEERASRAKALMAKGYAPLSRFGRYTVDVVNAEGKREYFGLFETPREANQMAARMRQTFGAAAVTQGTLSQEAFKLFAGITPETLELFGNALGLDSTGDAARDQAFQEYLRLTKSNRSAMKRMIHRQGIAGYSEDVARVLASFVYSNARQTAAGLHMGDLGEAVQAIPKAQGELKDAAFRLADYVKNPQEEAQAIRGLLFAQYLGGSIASAFVNMTQPAAVTFPWLSQFGGAKAAAAQMAKAAADMAKKRYEPALARALHLAEEDGTVSPQEVHQLMAQAQGSGALRSGDGTRQGEALALASNGLKRLGFAWGKVFSMSEQTNRRLTFIAAYRTAVERGMADPAKFARKAVQETQFVYSKASKMQWGRGAIGGTLMTFKTYSIAYLELLHRMATQGGPEGKRAALLALGMLMLMGGASGLPFAGDAEDVAEALARMLGYNISVKKARQELLEDAFGRDIAGFVVKGITGLPGMPLDVSGRLGMGNLIPGTGLLQPKSSHTSDMLEIVGPVGDLAKRGFSAAGKLLQGDVTGAALEASPTAARNLAKGTDMAATGMYRDAKGYKVLDTNVLEAALKAIGFQPQSVAAIQEANAEAQQAKNFYSLRAQEIRAKWAAGIFEQDQEKVQEARDGIADWNRKNPDQRMAISVPSVLKRVQEMRKSKDERIAATAPKAMRAQMREEFGKVREGL